MLQKPIYITYIYRLRKEFDTQNIDLLHALHRILLNIRSALKQEFANSVYKYWKAKIAKIPRNTADLMFPQINQICRPKGRSSLPTVAKPTNKENILVDAGVNKDTLISDASNNYLVTDPLDKLYVIGAHFARVYTQNMDLQNESLGRIVSTATNHLKQEINHELANNNTNNNNNTNHVYGK